MPRSNQFLFVDADADGRLLFVRTLRRVFPEAAVVEVEEYQAALSLLATQPFDAVVAHRALGADPISLISGLRQTAADIPILALSSSDRTEELTAAGASRFLRYDSWLLVGTTVAEMLETQGALSAERPMLVQLR